MPQLERSDAKAIEFLKETLEIGVYTKIKVAHGKRNPSKHAFLGRVRISILCSGETEGVVLRGQQELQWRRLEKRGWFSHISGRLGYVFLHLLILLAATHPPYPRHCVYTRAVYAFPVSHCRDCHDHTCPKFDPFITSSRCPSTLFCAVPVAASKSVTLR